MATLPLGALVDADIEAAVTASHLRDVPRHLLNELAADASRLRVPAGALIHRQGEVEPHLSLVVRGFIRGFVTAYDGRTLTVRYCRPGALIGVVSLYAPGYTMGGSFQALVESDVLALRPAVVRQLAAREPQVARALLVELSDRVQSFIAEIPGNAFATVRQRLARHLLDLASEAQRGPDLVAQISQQELADAVGSVREVVVRVLRDLRQEGLVETHRDRIRIIAPDRLLAEVIPAAPGTKVP